MDLPTPYHQPMQTVRDFQVTKFILAEAGTYNSQYLRPFQMDFRGETVGLLQEAVGNNTNVSAANLSGVASQFFRPTPTPEVAAQIIHGWGQKRFRFMLEIQYSRGGLTTNEIILGYTEHDGVSLQSSAIDENMRFFVNSVITTRNNPILGTNGAATQTVIADASQVLFDHNWVDGQSNIYANPSNFRLRPQDVYGAMSMVNDIPESVRYGLVDANIVSRSAPALSKRKHNIAGHYVANMINSYNTATADSMMKTEDEIYSDAAGYVRDALSSHNVFLKRIKELQGKDVAAFTYKELRNLDNFIDHKKQVLGFGAVSRSSQQLHQAGQTADWHGADAETLYATIIGQAMPALMMEYGIMQVHIQSTNNNLNAQPETTFHGINSFGNMDLSGPANALRQRFDIEIIRDMSYNNQIRYYVDCRFDLLGDSTITISLENSPLTTFTVPSFSDSLLTPLLTVNANRAYDVGIQFSAMFDNLGIAQANNYPATQHVPFNPTQSVPTAHVALQPNQGYQQPYQAPHDFSQVSPFKDVTF